MYLYRNKIALLNNVFAYVAIYHSPILNYVI